MQFKEFDITVPDNGADVVVDIKISGNALVSILNALQQYAAQTEREKNGWDNRVDWIVERIRDQLSDQRCARRNPHL